MFQNRCIKHIKIVVISTLKKIFSDYFFLTNFKLNLNTYCTLKQALKYVVHFIIFLLI